MRKARYVKTKSYHCPAFTLAEVLITLGIIGVVAALTIPALMNNIQDMQFKAAWKENFSILSQATINALSDNSGTMKGVSSVYDHNSLRDIYSPYLKTLKSCNGNAGVTYGYCWHQQGATSGVTKYFNNVVLGYNDLPLGSGSAGLILSNGAYVLFAYQDPACSSLNISGYGTEGLTNICGWMGIDVNGAKAPNIVGKDIYGLWVLNDRIAPMGIGTYKTSCSSSSHGLGCSAVYLGQ